MSKDPVEIASENVLASVQALADATDSHVELCLGLFGVVYYKYVHPSTCPNKDGKPKELPAHDDVPDVFKNLFKQEGGGDATND